MKLIPLSQGQFAKVDDDDFEKFGHLSWSAAWQPDIKSFYALRNTARDSDGRRTTERMHRLILGITDPRTRCDHVNHDGLDNRKENLRACNSSQNAANRLGVNANSKSGLRGVILCKRTGRWQAVIQPRGMIISLGYFSDKMEAYAAYVSANKKYFGKFGGSL